MFSPLKLLLILSTLVAVSRSQDVRVENFELADEIATNCDTVIEASRFEGDCCSLNVTQGGGCVVNIVNGRCKVSLFLKTFERKLGFSNILIFCI